MKPSAVDSPGSSNAEPLRALLEAALERARRLGAPVIARVHLPLDLGDPWSLWRALDGAVPGGVRAAWSEPGAGMTLLSAGIATRIDGRLDDAPARWATTLERWVDARSDVPAAMAGFAFAPTGPGWPGFGPGRVEVPRVLAWRRGHEGGAAVAIEIEPRADLATVHAQLDDVLRRVTAAVREAPRTTPVALRAGAALDTGDDTERRAWMALVDRARGAVASGQLDKLVVARRRVLEAPGGQAWHTEDSARALRAIEPAAQVFAVRGDGGWFVGATPELLVEVHSGQLSTVALAGTRARGATEAEDVEHARALVASTKDRLEHAIVVEAIRRRLALVSRAVKSAPAPRVVRFRAVMHLETRIDATVTQSATALDVARALHPTPAVSGAPTEAALAWLAAEEQLERGWYAGPIGWLDAAAGGHLGVALRSARLEGRRADAYVGCGIVAASDPAAEWDETEHKLRAIAEALGTRPEVTR